MKKEELLAVCLCIGCYFAGAFANQGQVIIAVLVAGACIFLALRRIWKRDREYRALLDTNANLWLLIRVERNRALVRELMDKQKRKEMVQ